MGGEGEIGAGREKKTSEISFHEVGSREPSGLASPAGGVALSPRDLAILPLQKDVAEQANLRRGERVDRRGPSIALQH